MVDRSSLRRRTRTSLEEEEGAEETPVPAWMAKTLQVCSSPLLTP